MGRSLMLWRNSLNRYTEFILPPLNIYWHKNTAITEYCILVLLFPGNHVVTVTHKSYIALSFMFSPQEKTREQKEAELIPKMQEAVNYGLKVLESAFEHLDIKAGNSDSEDEEATDRVEAILEPKVCSPA